MGRLEIRTASAGDWDGIADGYARVLHRDHRALRRKVAHAMGGNPQGCSSLVAIDTSGRAIAHLGASHVPMLVKGEPRLFGRFTACYIEPAYRTGGVHSLFFELDRLFQQQFEETGHLAAVFGQWEEIDWWFLRHHRGHKAVATSIDLVRGAEDPLRDRGAGDGVTITTSQYGADSAPALAVGECGVRRDATFNAWRAAFPGAPCEGWQARREDTLTGVAITRERGDERLILDWAVAPDDEQTGKALLAALMGDGTKPIRARFWTSDLVTLELFQDAGFVVEPGCESYLAVRTALPSINHLWLSQEWQVTTADAGTRALPQLTVGESIVYPPPPGTLDGRGRYGH